MAEKWIKVHRAFGRKFQTKIDRILKTLHSWWKKKTAYPVAQIDDFVKHIFLEHNQEADHLAHPGTFGRRKITIDGLKKHRGLEKRSVVSGTAAKQISARVAVAL